MVVTLQEARRPESPRVPGPAGGAGRVAEFPWPADPAGLAALRRRVQAWSEPHALPPEAVQDLQLVLGEAVTNSMEHAYRARPGGTVVVRLEIGEDGSVAGAVRDTGDWRQPPVDRGFRGRGLEIIRGIAADVVVDHPEDGGTRVRFRVPPAAGTPGASGKAAVPAPRRPGEGVSPSS